MDFFNRVFNKDDKAVRLQNEIKSLQVRKNSVLSVVKNELEELEREKKAIFCEAGMKVYENWNNRQENAVELVDYWNKVQEIEKKITEKEEKKKEMESRYDEEISLLQKDLHSNSLVDSKDVCPKCQAPIDEDDMFCEKCGTKLK